MSNENTSGGGVGFSSLLAIVFIVLKLTGVIAWSWWWVLSPIWVTFVAVGVVLIAGALAAIVEAQ